jgi:D-alanyl-D-alanine carboxypeptidase (penicillin-binding protein 5/6)
MLKKLVFLLVTMSIFSRDCYAFSTKAQYAFLMDTTTGEILYEKNSTLRMTPSSMSKLMTLYITFERLKSGNMKLQDNIIVSNKAWRMGGSRMFLSPNSFVSIENLVRGVIVHSGNDACVVLAEGIAGDERDFVTLMNAKAVELGLKNTQFANATGMPDHGHYMSAADIGNLSDRLIKDFPDYYHYFSEKEFEFNKIKQKNRNTMLTINMVDGLKTGHTESGKYGIAASSFKGNRRLIAVVNGLRDEKERAEEAQKLLQHGFLNFTNVTISNKSTILGEVPVFLGKVNKVSFSTKQPLVLTIPVVNKGQTEVKVTYPSKLTAPIDMDSKIGEVNIKLYDGRTYSFDLHPSETVERLGFFHRIYIKAKALITKEPKPNTETRIFMV